MTARPKVVLLGMMTKMPVAGVVWQTLHYLVGFQRLGFDPYYVEAHARTPAMLMRSETDNSSALAAGFIRDVMTRFGLAQKWAYHALHSDGRHFGMTKAELRRLYGCAEIIINFHGGTEPRPEHYATERLVYLETDPVQLQIELHDGRQETIDFLEPHCAFFTFAENYGRAGCPLPVSDRFTFRPTRQPVVLDYWRPAEEIRQAFTTVANWRQPWRDVSFGGEIYRWSKEHEFRKVIELPRRAGVAFELAVSGEDDADRVLLHENGWNVRDGLELSRDLDVYRRYIGSSWAEFTVAKEQNVKLRSGWFSDRSATYLASGRPVVTQDTGFGATLPTGAGLLPFTTLDEAVAAVESVEAEYERHSAAAKDIAHDYFDSSRVLARLLDDIGLPFGGRSRSQRRLAFPLELDLAPVSRRPTVLLEETKEAVLTGDLRRLPVRRASASPYASVVVVAHNGLPFTRLCVESVIADSDAPPYELLVVDNASGDGTGEYLDRVTELFAHVRVLRNGSNRGFPAGVNQGLEAAKGDMLVLLNNDVVVVPGWLERLARCLAAPKIGLAGAVTNRIGNEAELQTSYRTYGELIAFAEERARVHAGRVRDLGTATMFCLAMRRDAWKLIGHLDESFGLGTLEDDDYSVRARRAGFQVVCAEDVFVHHFGEASFGRLAASGHLSELLEENRTRFAKKWDFPWEPYPRRENPGYDELTGRIHDVVRRSTEPGSTVIVVSRGDERLLELDGRAGWHFPQTDGGVYAGHYPTTSTEAIAELERLRSRGGDYVLFPRPGFWWLDHYVELRAHLDARYRRVVVGADCVVYALNGAEEP